MRRKLAVLLCILLAQFSQAQEYVAFPSDTIYDEGLYIFEQNGRVMIDKLEKGALQTTPTYKLDKLTGKENYIWQIDHKDKDYTIYRTDSSINGIRVNGNNLYIEHSPGNLTLWTPFLNDDATFTFTTNRKSLAYISESEPAYKAYTAESSTLNRIKLYRVIEKPASYTREVTNGKMGSLCVPRNVTKYEGAIFYNIIGLDGRKLLLEKTEELVAGHSYLFLATSNTLKLTYAGDMVNEPIPSNGLIGSLNEQIEVPAVKGNYILKDNRMCSLAKGAFVQVKPNYAYLCKEEIKNISTKVKAKNIIILPMEEIVNPQ